MTQSDLDKYTLKAATYILPVALNSCVILHLGVVFSATWGLVMLCLLRWRDGVFRRAYFSLKICQASILAFACLVIAASAQGVSEDDIQETYDNAQKSWDLVAKLHSSTPPQLAREDYCASLREAEQNLQDLRGVYDELANGNDFSDQGQGLDFQDAIRGLGRELRKEWTLNGNRICDEPPLVGELGGPVEFGMGASWTGGYLGGELAKNSGRVRSTETSATTGAITNQFSDAGDPLGVGIVAGYNFRPWNNKIVVGPFASFDFLNQTINHTFAGGQFLGTTTHWIATVGAKGGYVVTQGLYLYGLVGASWLNQSLNVNFATVASSNVTTPGFTLGLGGEYQPRSWRLFGNPVSVFLQYQHTWWATANFNTPTSSPAFNYAFKREDDTIRLGVNIHLSR